MFTPRRCFALAMSCSLAFGGVMLARADDKTPGMGNAQAKIAEQQKELSDLQAHFDDALFVKIASMANAAEIKASEAAVKQSNNTEVKEFAQHMIDDHTAAGKQMQDLADKKSFIVHNVPDAKHKMAMEQMAKLKGSDYDKAYATAAVKDHEDAVALFKLAADNASDSDLKTWAKATLPTFEHHLKMARDLADKLSANATVH